MVDLPTFPTGSQPEVVQSIGPADLTIERFKLRELAEGWPCYRDAGEWENLKSIFHPGACIFTTWTGRTAYLDFIAASQRGMENGTFVLHRTHGSTTDINLSGTRAVTKMKATISQRFFIDGCEVDAEADCRFCFFWSKDPKSGGWGANCVRHWYEKDKLIPVDPRRIPYLNDERLDGYPPGYRYLAYCQELTMGVKIKLDMPGHLRDNNINGEMRDTLNQQVAYWVQGQNVHF